MVTATRVYNSPLRYPGGKGILSKLLTDIILSNNLEGATYIEPFAGGASVGLNLLENHIVDRIVLNDADRAVYAFWYSILHYSDSFISRIESIDVTIEEWHRQKEIYSSYNKATISDLGFAFFFLNRTNRSGILMNSGPIGGMKQTGKYKIDVRFNKQELINRIRKVQLLRTKITIKNKDALNLLSEYDEPSLAKAVIYLDPPYYNKGESLYLNNYSRSEHSALAQYLRNHDNYNWVLSYDYADEVINLYRGFSMMNLPILYSLQDKRMGSELLIWPDSMQIPSLIRLGQKSLNTNSLLIGGKLDV